MNKIAVITRFHYEQDSEEYRWRLDYYRDEVLPRLLRQYCQDFDIWIWCEPWQEKELKSLSPRIRTFRATYAKRDSHLFIDYTPWENVAGLPKYPVQIGLDSDDLVNAGFVGYVRELCDCNQITHIGFQPFKLDVKTQKRYLMDRYTEKRGSPIFAFYQPDIYAKDFKFAYHTSHLRMPVLAQKRIIVPEGYAYMSIHDRNDSTRIKKTDKLI